MRGLRLALSLTGRQPAFSPASLSPSVWYDASDLTTLYQDTAGTSPVTTAGQNVALVKDKSGNAVHVSQATAGNQPTYQTAGATAYLQGVSGTTRLLSSATITLTQPTTFFAVVYFDSIAGAPHIIDIDDLTRRYQLGIISSNLEMYANSAVVNFGIAPTTTALVLLAEFNAASSTIQRDNLTAVTGNPGTGAPTAAIVGLMNAVAGAANGVIGRLYTAGAISRLLTTAEKNNLRTYLGVKAGLVL